MGVCVYIIISSLMSQAPLLGNLNKIKMAFIGLEWIFSLERCLVHMKKSKKYSSPDNGLYLSFTTSRYQWSVIVTLIFDEYDDSCRRCMSKAHTKYLYREKKVILTPSPCIISIIYTRNCSPLSHAMKQEKSCERVQWKGSYGIKTSPSLINRNMRTTLDWWSMILAPNSLFC